MKPTKTFNLEIDCGIFRITIGDDYFNAVAGHNGKCIFAEMDAIKQLIILLIKAYPDTWKSLVAKALNNIKCDKQKKSCFHLISELLK